MEFTLFYQGELKSNGSIKHKQFIRREFHKQLMNIWEQGIFMSFKKQLIEQDTLKNWKIGNYNFLPLVNGLYSQVAQLNIFILWPDAPGYIVVNKGDIDNRLKTLLDALRVPINIQEIPKNESPKEDEDIFYCLLEDDKLITKISISTDRLLYPDVNHSKVKLFIRVNIKPSRMAFDDIAYAY
jgi:hypothetical protein